MFGLVKENLENIIVYGGFIVFGVNLFCLDLFGKEVKLFN